MNREQYLEELKTRLHGLEEGEIQDAIRYCEEYFEEAESDDKVIEDLGSPSQFASKIKTENALKMTKNPDNYRKPRSMMKSFLMILGGLIALPIALPLLLVAIILFFVFGLLIFILALVGVIVVFVAFYVAFATFMMSFFYANGIGDVLMHLGTSLIFLGIGIVSVLVSNYLIRKLLPIFVNKASDFYHRHKKGVVRNEAI